VIIISLKKATDVLLSNIISKEAIAVKVVADIALMVLIKILNSYD